MPYAFAVDFDPRRSGGDQESSLHTKFRQLLETVLPACHEAGDITGLAFTDHVRPAAPAMPCGRMHRHHSAGAA